MSEKDFDSKYRDMTETPVPSLLLRLALPAVISNLITMLYNMADTFFIGKISTSASAAVGVALSIQSIIQAIGFFFGQGAGNNMSRQLGKKNLKEARTLASNGFITGFIACALFSVVCLLFLDPVVWALGSTETIHPYAKSYIFYILLAAPFMSSSLTLNNLLRFQGLTFYSMIGLGTGGLLNLVLDPLLIFGLDLGIAGAAIATGVSQLVSFTLLFVLMEWKGSVHIRPKDFKPSLKSYRMIANGGLPSLCRQGVMSVATIFLNTAAKPFGDAVIAAMSIVNKIGNFTNSVLLGVGQGFQPLCGFNYGARKFDRVREAFWFSVKLMAVFILAVAVVEFIWADPIVGFFRDGDPEVIGVGARALRLRCFTMVFSVWMVMANMFLQTTGHVVSASVLGLLRQGLVLIPVVLILPPLIGLQGILLAQPIADTVSLLISIPMTLGMLRHMDEE